MFTSLARWWSRLWSPEPDFKATGLGDLLKKPKPQKPASKPKRKPMPTRRASGHLRADKRKTSKPRSPSKKG